MESTHLRHGTSHDLEPLLVLWSALGHDGHAADPRYRVREGGEQTARRLIEQWLGAARTTVVVAEDEVDGLVGFMAGRPAAPHEVLDLPPTFVVTDAFVRADHRRRGLGRALFTELVRAAGPGTVIEVGTLALDHRAVAFWGALGFGEWRVTLSRAPLSVPDPA